MCGVRAVTTGRNAVLHRHPRLDDMPAPHFDEGAAPSCGGAGGCGVSPSGFFAPGEENIVWPIRLSRLTEDWVYLILPPGGITWSDPPGTSDMYLSPRSPAEMISATVSSGSWTIGSMLIRTTARKVFGSSSSAATEPILMPLMRTSLPWRIPSTRENSALSS